MITCSSGIYKRWFVSGSITMIPSCERIPLSKTAIRIKIVQGTSTSAKKIYNAVDILSTSQFFLYGHLPKFDELADHKAQVQPGGVVAHTAPAQVGTLHGTSQTVLF